MKTDSTHMSLDLTETNLVHQGTSERVTHVSWQLITRKTFKSTRPLFKIYSDIKSQSRKCSPFQCLSYTCIRVLQFTVISLFR